MLKLFQYNWQVRNEWFAWCQEVPEEELLKKRTGGVGGILHTLFHIVDVEYSWINTLRNKPDFNDPFEDYASLRSVQELSEQFHREVEPFVAAWRSDMDYQLCSFEYSNGEPATFKHGEIMRHILSHEIHHIGQLSVWAREIGKAPIGASLIRRGLFD
jgi:uncharacterized damage-inducible protein DinB